MKKEYSLIGILFCACLILIGCDSDNDSLGTAADKVEYRLLFGSSYPPDGLYTSKSVKILRDNDKYQKEIVKYSNSAPPPVDFSTNSVLLVDMGERNSGGYSMVVTDVADYPNYVVATVTLTKPALGCTVTDLMTNPSQFVEIKTRKEILIREELNITHCR